MKVLITTLNAKYIHSNLAIRLLHSSIKNEHDSSFTEFTINDKQEDVIESINANSLDAIIISISIWNVEQSLTLIRKLKKINPRINIIVGGPEVTYDPEHFLTVCPEIDYICSGEGEVTVSNLLNKIENNEKIDLDSVSYRYQNILIINKTINEIDIETIEALDSPYRYEFDFKNQIIYFETSRGCPYRCSYCLSSLEEKVRFFSMEYIKSELLYLIQNNARTIKFLDRTFNVNTRRMKEIIDFIIKNHNKGQVFQFEITGELLPIEIIDHINEYAPKNLFRFEIGIQSTNDITNNAVDRKQDFDKLKNNIIRIQEGGIVDLHLDLIAGLPHEDLKTFEKTFNDCFTLNPKELQLGFLKMLRGTKIRRQADLYDYAYEQTAPYEITHNHVLNGADLKRIHIAEEMLEIYWNKGKMPTTLTYLNNTLPSMFDFFLNLGIFFLEKHSSFKKYQLIDIFTIIDEFFKDDKKYNIISSLLKYDYLKAHKIKPKRYWSTFSKEERKLFYQDIVKNKKIDINQDKLYKHTYLEEFEIDLDLFLTKNKIKKKKSMYVVSYIDSVVTFYRL